MMGLGKKMKLSNSDWLLVCNMDVITNPEYSFVCDAEEDE